ncbi:exosortase E/protease, VPEID-CTERM system [Methylomagnum ishizawai]|uniref:Exosortase E/protease, VPEID-CTERM system n=1 Tax=Methylomagnum ishizawai TaxID=1760988 RepID=A0A1Y6CYU2_9GAMM|nr:exosortase E/protease, VPEID-CTERM system [Methylomagnum ishizawai]SMF95839.1 exosortase E/protease, VPEID-CTERM system [Methylomagnum ishizawai]
MKSSYTVPSLFSPIPRFAQDTYGPVALFHHTKEIWKLGLWLGSGGLLLLAPRHAHLLGEFRRQSRYHRWQGWLCGQCLAFVALVATTAYLFAQPTQAERLDLGGAVVWAALLGATLWLWLLALAPARFWAWLVRREAPALVAGMVLGYCASRVVEQLVWQEAPLAQKELWGILSGYTLALVHTLLGWIYPDRVYIPESAVVGTPDFAVEITYACSGIEGISLIVLFIALYLGLFHKELRFPQSFWLFPLGICAIWLGNALRIAALIILGSEISPELASEGFHAQAGWIMLILIILGLLWVSHRWHYFATSPAYSPSKGGAIRLETGLLLPLLALLATTMITAAFSSGGFDSLYPLKVLVTLAVLGYCWNAYTRLGWHWDWQAPLIGGAVFAVWMALEPDSGADGAGLAQGLAGLSGGPAALWLVFRVLGSVVAVPLAEELAFRGYLLRKLIARDIETVPPGRFTWVSFLASSVLFGLLHERWLAGSLAGMGYALALYRRGRIGDAVVAHMTTNGLIALTVLARGRWGLWT